MQVCGTACTAVGRAAAAAAGGCWNQFTFTFILEWRGRRCLPLCVWSLYSLGSSSRGMSQAQPLKNNSERRLFVASILEATPQQKSADILP